ncbi:TetR/AcrR family transcriptional regulator [Cupriavidus sp. IDO]|uniref:TetR/AcrR family transcriptional regulator n=1 Tax=Cupriavidus sp. IDO TaxID=1539142 RepID=UPI0005797E13|nr:TetR/AcrR family transcriptional regulator [Cupriavidus sp. IDO]KWR77790.1 TetR family transcriptional regulator [Cupriavidus sp. IDO]
MATSGRRQAATHRSEQRIEELLAVAKDVFASHGFERATTQEIAQRAGVSEATVFAYFGSKRELCVEVIRRWYGHITAEIQSQLPTGGGLRDQLQFIVRKHLDNLMGEGVGICALVLTEGRTADKAFTEIIAELKRSYTAPLMTALRTAHEAGVIRNDMPLRLMRDMVYGSMEHVLWDYVVSGSKPDIAVTSTQLTDMLFSAFAPRRPSENALMDLHADLSMALKRFEAKSH